MTYTVLSGTLNSTIPYHTIPASRMIRDEYDEYETLVFHTRVFVSIVCIQI